MKNKEQLESYKNSGHLLNKKIQCNKCSSDITCFGSNLDSKIKKYGGIETLLETFSCRKCISSSKPKKIVIKVKRVSKKEKIAEKNLGIPKMKFSIPRNVFLLDAPDIQKACSSNGNCLSPSFYLDHNKSCIGCAFIENCCSTLKRVA